MKHIVILQLFFICGFSYSQNFQISKIVVDKNTKIPLENVTIFNESDFSTTNAEGKFVFVSKKNEINLNLLGYEPIKTTFDRLKTEKDTVFMESKATQLREVVVGNAGPYMKKVYDKFQDNLLQNYTIDFFLRNVFKKDKVNILLQDIYARKNQIKGQKKNLTIEILNMRKTSFFEKNDKINFGFPDFDGLLSNGLPQIDKCSFTETPFNDSDFKKILFEYNEKDQSGQIQRGYFIINRKDYAIVEYSLSFIEDPEKVPYKTVSRGKYRTTKLEKFVQFTKDSKSNKYYQSNVKIDNQVDIIVYKISENPFNFDFTMDFFVTNRPINEKINSNFAVNKDIFRAKFPYSKEFWTNQNQLPLTNELELFLKSVSDKKDKTKEFEVISNF
ncbi:peptidase associated/transthyretin-like domain-containing protein [Flavobacterium gilvum]|uniref:Carboxypeptidase-like regulatory domain-containing protein n=1 Tax=Flavobacterium gilvum TaxID=1492737 RepID=A0AAC9I1X9_9FLAO|nr:hypothetical protein [Flavobacterium gilvum]AOW08596.1 hypothetical protein EM308_03285 [Flavobacterium gilvum]KFC59693.1 hypothetical protein FEM08_14740 [Flavobacterium gilvum]